jgi:hypothetical protein
MASLFSGPPATRPLVLHSQAARVNILVPASPLSAWVASEVLAQEFHDSPLSKDDAPAPAADEDDEGAAVPTGPDNESQVKLLARFLGFAADKLTAGGDNTSEIAQVVLAAYNRFNELFLGTVNIHSLLQSYDPEPRAEILTAYFKAFAALRAALGDKEVPIAHASALIEAAKNGDAEIYGLFGGQGVNEVSLGSNDPERRSVQIADFGSTTLRSSSRSSTSTAPSLRTSSPRSRRTCSSRLPRRRPPRATPTTSTASTSSRGSTAPSPAPRSTTSRRSRSRSP